MTWLVEIAYQNATTGEVFWADSYPEDFSEMLVSLHQSYFRDDTKSGVGITVRVVTGNEEIWWPS
jgi:hypothetical protein